MPTSDRIAPGAPGIEPRWTSSAKDGIGTAYHPSSRLWFTLSHGLVNEVYYPHVDTPNTRDLQFLITDGETFCHEERRDLEHLTEYQEKNVLLYQLRAQRPLTHHQRNHRRAGLVGSIDAHPAGNSGSETARQAASLCAARPAPERHGSKQFSALAQHGWPKLFRGVT